MRIGASLKNTDGWLHVSLTTNDRSQTLDIPPKPDGRGSGANGGDLLFLAVAACYCNDIYREAARLGIEVTGVEVVVEGDFGRPGEPGRNISYKVRLMGWASADELRSLAVQTDAFAEIHNTLRAASAVRLAAVEAIPV